MKILVSFLDYDVATAIVHNDLKEIKGIIFSCLILA